MNTLTTDESARLLYAIKHTRIYWPVLIALSTGMRRGEVLALRWRNVDFEGAFVRVVESLEQTKTGIRFKSPKTDRTRAVTLPAFCIEELRRLKCQQAEELLMLGVGQTAETLVCAGRRRTVAASKPDASIHSPDNADRGPPPDQASRFAT